MQAYPEPMLGRALLRFAVVVCVFGLTDLAIAADVRGLLQEGESMAADRAASLEDRLEVDPLDSAARTRLLGYYGRHARTGDASSTPYARLRYHVLWLIHNDPRSEALAEPASLLLEFNRYLDPEKFIEGKQAFLAHLEKDPNDLTLLERAADFVTFRDRSVAVELGERARSLDSSNPKWTIRLAFDHYNCYRVACLGSGKTALGSARDALVEFERAFDLMDENRSQGYWGIAAGLALALNETAKAREYAVLMLNGDLQGSHHYWYNYHYGNIALGRIALAEGDVQRAVSYLLLARSAGGSPELNSSGPDTELARQLLEEGERESVLRYFDLCAGFWGTGQDLLREWATLVKAGMTPKFQRF